MLTDGASPIQPSASAMPASREPTCIGMKNTRLPISDAQESATAQPAKDTSTCITRKMMNSSPTSISRPTYSSSSVAAKSRRRPWKAVMSRSIASKLSRFFSSVAAKNFPAHGTRHRNRISGMTSPRLPLRKKAKSASAQRPSATMSASVASTPPGQPSSRYTNAPVSHSITWENTCITEKVSVVAVAFSRPMYGFISMMRYGSPPTSPIGVT